MNGYKRGTVKRDLGEATGNMVRDQMKGNVLRKQQNPSCAGV